MLCSLNRHDIMFNHICISPLVLLIFSYTIWWHFAMSLYRLRSCNNFVILATCLSVTITGLNLGLTLMTNCITVNNRSQHSRNTINLTVSSLDTTIDNIVCAVMRYLYVDRCTSSLHIYWFHKKLKLKCVHFVNSLHCGSERTFRQLFWWNR